MREVPQVIAVYHWSCGAFVNSYAGDFDALYHELVDQYGLPNYATTYWS